MTQEYDLKPLPPGPVVPRQPRVLPYRARPRPDDHSEDWGPIPAILGFDAAVGIVLFAFRLFTTTSHQSAGVRCMYLGAVGIAFIGLVLARVPLKHHFGFAGFGRGLLAGTLLALTALFPCAALYALFGS